MECALGSYLSISRKPLASFPVPTRSPHPPTSHSCLTEARYLPTSEALSRSEPTGTAAAEYSSLLSTTPTPCGVSTRQCCHRSSRSRWSNATSNAQHIPLLPSSVLRRMACSKPTSLKLRGLVIATAPKDSRASSATTSRPALLRRGWSSSSSNPCSTPIYSSVSVQHRFPAPFTVLH